MSKTQHSQNNHRDSSKEPSKTLQKTTSPLEKTSQDKSRQNPTATPTKASPSKTIIKLNSFTTIMATIQVLIFMISKLYAKHMLKNEETGYSCLLYKLGANHAYSILADNEVHRLVLALFLHTSLRQLFFSVLSLLCLGYFLEAKYGTKKVMLVYFLAGFGGHLLGTTAFNMGFSVGASSAVCGLLALRFVCMIENYYQNSEVSGEMGTLIQSICANIGMMADSNGTENTSNLGGFLIGAAIALQFMKLGKSRKFRFMQIAAIGSAMVFLLYCCFILGVVKEFGDYSNLKREINTFSNGCNMP